jgi:hypothetical protein
MSALGKRKEEDVVPELQERLVKVSIPRIAAGDRRVRSALDRLKDSHDESTSAQSRWLAHTPFNVEFFQDSLGTVRICMPGDEGGLSLRPTRTETIVVKQSHEH